MKTSEKFLFLFVVIAAVLFARFAYPDISGLPAVATANTASSTQIADAATVTAPPTLVLPQTALAGTAGSGAGTASGSSNTADTTLANTVFSKAGDTRLPAVNDEAYMVADLTTGGVFAGLDLNTRWPTASLTKLMTATLVFDQLSTSTEITITPEMFSADPDEETLVVGGRYTVEDLLHVMLMPSSNVAAQAFADFLGETQFMSEMNQRAQAWGMTDTYFDDPSGISAANESTPHDLLILAQHVYQNYPGILAITDTHQTTITEQNSGRKVLVTSINDYAGEPDFIGGKTGNTVQAEGNLLSLFDYDGHPVLVIVLGTVDRFGDSTKLYAWFRQDYK